MPGGRWLCTPVLEEVVCLCLGRCLYTQNCVNMSCSCTSCTRGFLSEQFILRNSDSSHVIRSCEVLTARLPTPCMHMQARAADDDMPALYGAGDHSEVEPVLTPARMFTLSARAIYLIGVFLPFLTLGLFCLLLANWASPTPGVSFSATTALEQSALQRKCPGDPCHSGKGCRTIGSLRE